MVKRWVNGVIGGWHLDTIMRFNDGLPIHLPEASPLTSYNYEIGRPNTSSQVKLKTATPTTLALFNTAVVSRASTREHTGDRHATPLDRQRTLRQDQRYRYRNAEGISPLYRETKFIFRAEAYNITNTPEFAPPDTNLGDSGFGQVTGPGALVYVNCSSGAL